MTDVPPEIEKLYDLAFDVKEEGWESCSATSCVSVADAEAAVLACEQRMRTDWNAAILTLRSACCTRAGREQVERELVRPFGFDGELRDEFDGEGCCPDEDGYLRAQAGDRIARAARERTVAEIVEALREHAAHLGNLEGRYYASAANYVEQRFGAKKEDP